MLPQARDLASGSFVPSNPSIVGCTPRRGSLSLACEQFWGRAVQASRDSLDPGRFLFVAQVFQKNSEFHFRPIALADMRLQTKDYLPGPSENIGTSSVFPDDRLR